MTETVKTPAARSGFSLVAADKGAFSLPGRTTRGWEEKRGADFVVAMGGLRQSSFGQAKFMTTYGSPVCALKEVTEGAKLFFRRRVQQLRRNQLEGRTIFLVLAGNGLQRVCENRILTL
jgi:hypothetical protein